MRILVACEQSGACRRAFRARGHDAWSCDLLPADDGSEHHFQGDVLPVLEMEWDMVIAFPPCTHLATSGAAHFEKKRADGRQQAGIDFFMRFTNLLAPKVCIENPVGIMSRVWRRPDQIIQPYYFGDEFQKTTCLWLKGLPKLQHAAESDWFAEKTHVARGEMVTFESGKTMPKWYVDARKGNHGQKRSVTFPGIANAMAAQWSPDLTLDSPA